MVVMFFLGSMVSSCNSYGFRPAVDAFDCTFDWSNSFVRLTFSASTTWWRSREDPPNHYQETTHPQRRVRPMTTCIPSFLRAESNAKCSYPNSSAKYPYLLHILKWNPVDYSDNQTTFHTRDKWIHKCCISIEVLIVIARVLHLMFIKVKEVTHFQGKESLGRHSSGKIALVENPKYWYISKGESQPISLFRSETNSRTPNLYFNLGSMHILKLDWSTRSRGRITAVTVTLNFPN